MARSWVECVTMQVLKKGANQEGRDHGRGVVHHAFLCDGQTGAGGAAEYDLDFRISQQAFQQFSNGGKFSYAYRLDPDS